MNWQPLAEETIRWAIGIVADATRSDMNRPFKHMTAEALGRSVLAIGRGINFYQLMDLVACLDREI